MGEEEGRFKAGRYAAIDIGTVTARLLIADVDGQGNLTEIAKDQAICNLGVGVDKTGLLDPEAIARVVAVVGRFVDTIASLQPSHDSIVVTANATSASRDARNSADFVDALADLGVTLSVIPGEREAALSFAGATSAFSGRKVVVLDIGGGSTEVIAGISGDDPEFARSFNIGCRRVTERCLPSDPPAPEELAAASGWIFDEMAPYLRELTDAGYRDAQVIAVAGTATSIISMREEMQVYDSARVHGAVASVEDVSRLLDRLSSLTLEQRRHLVGLDPGRAPVIVAGLVIMGQVLTALGAPSFTASERDILHGIILDAAR